ncbi:GntR family transcriptional regulator [Ornithinimicrobium cavernae]|uniref:GntR family transcriptional regulator n=1 Tax=Ornithinimicrobium cavernae TaxID=2666047 RepID=UPI000D686B60|nr:GntR family transcriptional regulator [Ornithinimicrobium cavernae]
MISTTALERDDSLRDKALRILRQAIVSGEIQAGELYSATALARRLQVSVSPVREAMLTLVNAGIMEPVRNRGFRVAELGESDLDEIFELRVLLEVPAVQALAATDLSGERERLEELVRATEESARDGDVTRFLATDREFHLALIEQHGNGRLTDWVANLRDQTRLYGLKDSHSHPLVEAAAEHRAILEAILEGEGEQVGQLLTSHLSHIRNEWASGPGQDVPE